MPKKPEPELFVVGFPRTLFAVADGNGICETYQDPLDLFLDNSEYGPVRIGIYKLVEIQETRVQLVIGKTERILDPDEKPDKLAKR